MEVLYLPGLASDHKLFCPLIERLGGQCLQWLKHSKNESISDYSKRVAELLSEKDTANICLVGLCFGGVVAMEVAQHIPLHSVVTVNTPGDSHDISDDFRKGVKIGTKFPESVLKGLLAMKGASFFKAKDNLNDEDTQLVGQMIRSLDIGFMCWAAKVSAAWDRPEPFQFSCPRLALHGELEAIVRRPGSMPVELMEGVGHLAPITHPDVLSSRIQHFWKNIPA